MKKFQRSAFTMVELIFVIVILGILAAIAIPKLAATRDDAEMAKGRSDVAAIRAAIVSERQSRLLTGSTAYAATLDGATPNSEGQVLFNNPGLLAYGIISADRDGHWMKTGTNTYAFKVMKQGVTFTYTQGSGTFDCNRTAAGNAGVYCKALID